MSDMDSLQRRRLVSWHQTAETRLTGPDEAAHLIERVGMATLFPASSEIPNLYHAYVGDPAAQVEPEWDSPAGEVYGWRWHLGRQNAAFYATVVRNRPTWVSWSLLPAVVRLRGELRVPDELYHAGELSAHAYRLAEALDAAGGVLSTGELRNRAGFPAGKAQRAAYLRALGELDSRLLVAKVFSADDEDMRHALVRLHYAPQVDAAERMTFSEALHQFLLAYLPHAVYAVPAALAKHLKLAEPELRAGLERLAGANLVAPVTLPGQSGPCYLFTAG